MRRAPKHRQSVELLYTLIANAAALDRSERKTPPSGGVFTKAAAEPPEAIVAQAPQAFLSCHPGTGNTGFACAAFAGSTTFG